MLLTQSFIYTQLNNMIIYIYIYIYIYTIYIICIAHIAIILIYYITIDIYSLFIVHGIHINKDKRLKSYIYIYINKYIKYIMSCCIQRCTVYKAFYPYCCCGCKLFTSPSFADMMYVVHV